MVPLQPADNTSGPMPATALADDSMLLRGKWSQVALLTVSELLAMGVWFSASAVVPQLATEWSLGPSQQSWLTMMVQLGFVAGAVTSAMLNLPDRLRLPLLIAGSCAVAAVANGVIPWVGDSIGLVMSLRFVTGFALAGVYPPGMKVIATWCRRDRGLGIGILVGGLTVGSALPHLVNAVPLLGAGGMPEWRMVLTASSGLALVGSLLAALFVRTGPYLSESAPFDWRYATSALRDRPTRLANFGYFGHMWELYAVWTWVPLYILASYQAADLSVTAARIAGFAAIAIGGPACIIAGALADRVGRTTVTIVSLVMSGCCALGAGFLFSSPLLLTGLCLVWGFAVVADSAQFSAAVSELADERYVGTALTMQTAIGFLLTVASIRLTPAVADQFGWGIAFAVLCLGPLFGGTGMALLRRLPAARRMASGNR